MENYITTDELRRQKARNTLNTLLAINRPRKVYTLENGEHKFIGMTPETAQYTLLRQLQAYLTEAF